MLEERMNRMMAEFDELEMDAFQMMIKNTSQLKRYSGLCQRLLES